MCISLPEAFVLALTKILFAMQIKYNFGICHGAILFSFFVLSGHVCYRIRIKWKSLKHKFKSSYQPQLSSTKIFTSVTFYMVILSSTKATFGTDTHTFTRVSIPPYFSFFSTTCLRPPAYELELLPLPGSSSSPQSCGRKDGWGRARQESPTVRFMFGILEFLRQRHRVGKRFSQLSAPARATSSAARGRSIA